MYHKYLKEREGLEVFELPSVGFVTYKFRHPDCYIQDIYVVPEHRLEGVAAKLADEVAKIAKSKGYMVLTGSVDIRANGADSSDKVLRAYGMAPYTTEGHLTYYVKGI